MTLPDRAVLLIKICGEQESTGNHITSNLRLITSGPNPVSLEQESEAIVITGRNRSVEDWKNICILVSTVQATGGVVTFILVRALYAHILTLNTNHAFEILSEYCC